MIQDNGQVYQTQQPTMEAEKHSLEIDYKTQVMQPMTSAGQIYQTLGNTTGSDV